MKIYNPKPFLKNGSSSITNCNSTFKYWYYLNDPFSKNTTSVYRFLNLPLPVSMITEEEGVFFGRVWFYRKDLNIYSIDIRRLSYSNTELFRRDAVPIDIPAQIDTLLQLDS